MRFKIILDINGRNNFLPIDYQYYISSWIYKRIAAGNQEFAHFLHSQGYGEGNRRFKFFNFSPLDLKPYHFHRERSVFELLGRRISVQVSFFLPEAAEPFIKGLFINNEVFIGDRINGVQLKVAEVHVLPSPQLSEVMNYRLISPCCITRPPRDEEAYGQYLGPDDEEFIPRMIDNLETKFEVARQVPSYAGDFNDDINIDIKLLGKEPKSKLVKIKSLTTAETKVRGWLFDCTVTAPVEVQEFIWDVGLGEKGSMGFGMVDIKR